MNTKEFLDYIAARGYSANTVNAYKSDLSDFEAFLRERHVRATAARPQLIQEYVRELGSRTDAEKLSPSTIWRKLATLSSYYEFLRVQTDGRVRNPVRAVARPRRRRADPKGIEDEPLERLLSGIANLRDKAIITLIVTTGLRLAELHQLNRDSINVERKQQPDGSVRVLGSGSVIGKGNKERAFLTDLPTLQVLGDYLRTRQDSCNALFISNRGMRVSRREIQYILERWCKRLGLPPVHIHSLRHTYATRLANAGLPSITLKDLMGHASFNTTQGYFKIKRQKLSADYFAAMELIND